MCSGWIEYDKDKKPIDGAGMQSNQPDKGKGEEMSDIIKSSNEGVGKVTQK